MEIFCELIQLMWKQNVKTNDSKNIIYTLCCEVVVFVRRQQVLMVKGNCIIDSMTKNCVLSISKLLFVVASFANFTQSKKKLAHARNYACIQHNFNEFLCKLVSFIFIIALWNEAALFDDVTMLRARINIKSIIVQAYVSYLQLYKFSIVAHSHTIFTTCSKFLLLFVLSIYLLSLDRTFHTKMHREAI